MASVTASTEPEITPAFSSESTPKQTTSSSFATDDLNLSKRRLRLVIIIILGISLLFQTIALAAPGWTIAWHGKKSPFPGMSASVGVFYSVVCVTSEDIFSFDLDNEGGDITDDGEEEEPETICRSRSYLDAYRGEAEDASDSRKLSMKREYNLGKARQQIGATIVWISTLLTVAALVYTVVKRKQVIHLGFVLGCVLSVTERDYTLDIVHSQVGVMVAWLCTLISTIVLLKIYRKREPVPKTLSVLSSSMAVAGIIMGEVIYVYLVKIDAKVRIARLANRSSVGFPYSLFFYIPACTVILLSDAVLFKCLHNDIITLSHVKADTGLYDDITTFSHTRADTGPSDDITTPNDARADTGPSDDITTLNHARADTGPDSYLIPLSQARADTGRDNCMSPLSQARADTSHYNYINPLSQAGSDTGTYSYVTPLTQARPDTSPSAMLELPQIPTTTQVPSSQARADTGTYENEISLQSFGDKSL